MNGSPLAQAACLIEQAFALISASPDSLSNLLEVQGVIRQAERVTVEQVAAIERDGTLAAKGYKSSTSGLKDLLDWDHDTASRYVEVAQHVGARTALDGSRLEPVLPATAAAFTAGATTLRHVEVIAGLLDSKPATRISLADRESIEAGLGEAAQTFTPLEVRIMGRQLLDAADLDGAAPDDRPGRNELHVHRNLDGTGSIHGVFDDPAAFAPILTALDARTRPSAETRGATVAEKNAAALVEICEFALRYQHGGKVAGERPHVTVTMSLAELEARARGALLDMGGELTPGQLRRMLCDARIVPVVLGERSEPLDVGRAQRTVSDPLRRLIAARDRGCAHPGCDRPPSWCEVHHVLEWQHGGSTSIDNPVMLCGAHHDQVHETEWRIDMSTGIPRFIAPDWLESLWGAT